MKRITKDGVIYKSEFLLKLQQYENTGFQPEEITPKPGSIADKQRGVVNAKKKKVTLEKLYASGGGKASYEVVCDGVKMSAYQFSKMVSVQASTICRWAREGTFYDRLRERGII